MTPQSASAYLRKIKKTYPGDNFTGHPGYLPFREALDELRKGVKPTFKKGAWGYSTPDDCDLLTDHGVPDEQIIAIAVLCFHER